MSIYREQAEDDGDENLSSSELSELEAIEDRQRWEREAHS